MRPKDYELWGDHVRVRFEIGDYYHGEPAPEWTKYRHGYKTLRADELKVIADAP